MKSSEKAAEPKKELKEKVTRVRKKTQEESKLSITQDPIKKRLFSTKRFIFQIFFILFGVAIGMAAYHQFFANSSEKDQTKLLSSLAEIMILPQEEATIFDINDPELLTKDQDFFVGSIKGDKLVVYPIAGKAIIYRPDAHLIVNVGPVMFDEQNNSSN